MTQQEWKNDDQKRGKAISNFDEHQWKVQDRHATVLNIDHDAVAVFHMHQEMKGLVNEQREDIALTRGYIESSHANVAETSRQLEFAKNKKRRGSLFSSASEFCGCEAQQCCCLWTMVCVSLGFLGLTLYFTLA